jgi:hypothetical protein
VNKLSKLFCTRSEVKFALKSAHFDKPIYLGVETFGLIGGPLASLPMKELHRVPPERA